MTTATLPQRERERLQELRESNDLDALRAFVAALRANNWTLAAIGEPLGVGRSTVRLWETRAELTGITGVVQPEQLPVAPLPKSRQPKTPKIRKDVPEDEKDKLRSLYRDASQVRRYTPAESHQRKAGRKLDVLLEGYVADGIPMARLAEAMGVTHRAVRARLQRHRARAV